MAKRVGAFFSEIFRCKMMNAFIHCALRTFPGRKSVQQFPIKIDLYRRIQSELRADFLCIEELPLLAVQCMSFRLPTRNISSQRDQSDRGLFCIKYFGTKIAKKCKQCKKVQK